MVKNRGEIEVLRVILPKLKHNSFKCFYKFGGRYKLDDDYNELYDHNYDAVMKIIPGSINPYNRDIIEPVIYCISKNKLMDFVDILTAMSIKVQREVIDVERLLAGVINIFNVKCINRLNVSGNSAVLGIFKKI